LKGALPAQTRIGRDLAGFLALPNKNKQTEIARLGRGPETAAGKTEKYPNTLTEMKNTFAFTVLTAFVLSFTLLTTQSTAAAHPNILLVIADDYGIDNSSLYNTNARASLPPTPNINSLYDSGILFRNAYSYPTCSPTRSSILTGRYGFRTGIGFPVMGDGPALPANELTIPKILTTNPQLGYRHANIGKWHLGFAPTDPNVLGGWSHFSGHLAGRIESYFRWTKRVNGVTTTSTSYATTDTVNDSIAWIQQQGTNNWFLWLAFNAPHDPFHKPPNALHSYDALSANESAVTQNPRPYYEAMTEAMDTEFGRSLNNIDRSKTIIIFIGDNGTPREVAQPPFVSERAKGTLYEAGIDVPMIIAGPVVRNPHRESTELVHTADLFASILELAGANLKTVIPPDLRCDSHSLLPILTNGPFVSRKSLLNEQFHPTLASARTGRAICNDTFKLISLKTGTEEFYDLVGDPYEETNLLSRGLTPDQLVHHTALAAELAGLQNFPDVIESSYNSNRFSVSVNYVQGVTFSLYRSSAFDRNAWKNIPSLTQRTNFSVTLTDPNALQGANYYCVAAPLR
jgi:arylsulfatase B